MLSFLRSVEMEGAAAEAPERRRRVPLGQLPNALKSEPAQLDTMCELELECDETAESLETCVPPPAKRRIAPHRLTRIASRLQLRRSSAGRPRDVYRARARRVRGLLCGDWRLAC